MSHANFGFDRHGHNLTMRLVQNELLVKISLYVVLFCDSLGISIVVSFFFLNFAAVLTEK